MRMRMPSPAAPPCMAAAAGSRSRGCSCLPCRPAPSASGCTGRRRQGRSKQHPPKLPLPRPLAPAGAPPAAKVHDSSKVRLASPPELCQRGPNVPVPCGECPPPPRVRRTPTYCRQAGTQVCRAGGGVACLRQQRPTGVATPARGAASTWRAHPSSLQRLKRRSPPPPPNPAARQNWRTNTTSKVPGPVIISIAPIVDAQGFSALLGIVAIDTNRAPIKCNCRPSVKDNCK